MIKERPERGPRPSVERVERGGLPSDGDSLLETPERPEHVEAVVALHVRALGAERQSSLEVGVGALPVPLCRATDGPRATYASARSGASATAFSAAASARRWPAETSTAVSPESASQYTAGASPAQAGANSGSIAIALS
jgi:hypothetical protein